MYFVLFQSLKKISNEKGFDCVVLGCMVCIQVWIHFFIGDTEGNNEWLGQYPGNKEGVKRPYWNCKYYTYLTIKIGTMQKGDNKKMKTVV